MRPLETSVNLPRQASSDPRQIATWIGLTISTLTDLLSRMTFRSNGSYTKDALEPATGFLGEQQSEDRPDPGTGQFVIWQSDGTGTGDDGDILIKITDSNGTTKTTTLVDFSAV